MKLFKFKNRYDISLVNKSSDNVIYKHHMSVIKLGSKLIVPSEYVFVVGKKGKVYDLFDEGEYNFSEVNLPLISKKENIKKKAIDKNQNKIKADLYFVNKSLYAGKFETYRNVSMGTKAYGFYNCKVYGVYSYKVKEAKEFMQSLLNEWDYVKTGEAEKILENWTNELIVNELEKQNFIINDVVQNKPIILDHLKVAVSKFFAVCGLELVDLRITKYKLPKEYQTISDKNIQMQKKLEEDLKMQQDLENNVGQEEVSNNDSIEFVKSDDFENYLLFEKEQESMEGIKENEKCLDNFNDYVKQAKEYLKQFEEDNKNQNVDTEKQSKKLENSNMNEQCFDYGLYKGKDNAIESNCNENIYTNKNPNYLKNKNKVKLNNISDEYIPFGNFVIDEVSKDNEVKNINGTANKKSFVDLNVSNKYNNQEDIKRCLNCGMENHKDADHCLICGEKFDKGDLYD